MDKKTMMMEGDMMMKGKGMMKQGLPTLRQSRPCF
jgi:hypothetical protein